MNTISRILLGAVVLAVCACLWYLLTQKNKGSTGCSGNCAGCATPCGSQNKRNQQ